MNPRIAGKPKVEILWQSAAKAGYTSKVQRLESGMTRTPK